MDEFTTATLPHEASLSGAPNGAAAVAVAPAPPPAPTGPRIAKRPEWFPKKGATDDASVAFREAYPGFLFEMWVNYPQRLEVDLTAADEDRDLRNERIRRALKTIVLRHNGWVIEDEETGQDVELPSPATDEFWNRIPNELATAVIIFVLRAAGALPNSMVARLTNSRRG